MVGRRGPRGPTPDTSAVALLGLVFVVVALLLGQALLALRSHEQMMRTALEDFAGFASDRIAEALNTTVSAVFLDRTVAARTVHYAWVAGDTSVVVPEDPDLPDDAIPVYFTLDGTRVVAHSGELDEEIRSWIVGEVRSHADGPDTRPAPYTVLRGPEARAIVYREEEYYGEPNLYGFVVRFDRLGPVYESLLDDLSILPRSLAGAAEPERMVSVRLFFPEDEQTLFARRAPEARPVVTARSYAVEAGRIAVDVELDAAAARALVPGGYPNARLPLLVGLALLTFGLLTVAVVLTRRATRLNELRELFIANASHDLRTPLAQIRMFSETLLLDRMTDPDERRRSLDIIRGQAAHLGDLVENILHASGRGGAPPERTETDLDDLLDDTVAALAPAVAARNASVVQRREGPAAAHIDATTLRRVTTNLVDNALKFGPRGQNVTITVRNLDGQVEVAVDDEGPGVPGRDRTRVWERFERLHQRHPGASGTGLGLAVVRDLARRHGGSVRIEDAPGGGARMVVTLATEERAP